MPNTVCASPSNANCELVDVTVEADQPGGYFAAVTDEGGRIDYQDPSHGDLVAGPLAAPPGARDSSPTFDAGRRAIYFVRNDGPCAAHVVAHSTNRLDIRTAVEAGTDVLIDPFALATGARVIPSDLSLRPGPGAWMAAVTVIDCRTGRKSLLLQGTAVGKPRGRTYPGEMAGPWSIDGIHLAARVAGAGPGQPTIDNLTVDPNGNVTGHHLVPPTPNCTTTPAGFTTEGTLIATQQCAGGGTAVNRIVAVNPQSGAVDHVVVVIPSGGRFLATPSLDLTGRHLLYPVAVATGTVTSETLYRLDNGVTTVIVGGVGQRLGFHDPAW